MSKEQKRKFIEWLDLFVQEKKLDTDFCWEVRTEKNGIHWVTLAIVIENLNISSIMEQSVTKKYLVNMDLRNGDVMNYFGLLARGVAESYSAEPGIHL